MQRTKVHTNGNGSREASSQIEITVLFPKKMFHLSIYIYR